MKFLFTFILIIAIGCSSTPKKVQKITQSPPPDTMRLVFSGDFMQHTPQVTAARTNNGFDYTTQLKYITWLWKSADFSIINLETTLSDTPPYTGYPMFKSPMQIAQALKNSGITHTALANNHALDRGKSGAEKTAKFLDEAGLERIGVWLEKDSLPKSYTILTKGKLKVAILNHSYGTNGMPLPKGVRMNMEIDTLKILEDIKGARADSVTHIIAFMHWGDEYVTMPNSTQKKLALWLREKGVNSIIGSHPHTAQPIDHENSIVYSLGNFTSNQRKINTDAGLSAILTITKSDTVQINHIAHFCDISTPGVEKYRVLSIADTAVVQNISVREYMKSAIERVEKIINTPVLYN